MNDAATSAIALPSIARRIPDLARWVEARALLLSEEGQIFGLQETPELSLVIREPETNALFVIGAPALSAIRTALAANERGGEVIAPMADAAWLAELLPGWKRNRIIVHKLEDAGRLPQPPADAVRFLAPALIPHMPIDPELRQELESGAGQSLIAATFVEQQPVSFCYAGAITESLWDVSIDTVPQYQRRSYAAWCAAYMIRHMEGQGKKPVWQALEDNPASWRLAEKLGFKPVDELAFFTLTA